MINSLCLISQGVSFVSTKKTESKLTIEFLSRQSNILSNSIDLANLKVKLNKNEIPFTPVSSSTSITKSSKSILFSLDISNSFDNSRLDLVKSTIRNYLDYLEELKPEIAISSFNQKGYLNQDFTTNYQKAKSELSFISQFGALSFDAAFFDNVAGAEKVFQDAKYQKHLIIIADSYGDISQNQVVQSINDKNYFVHIIFLDKDLPRNLTEIAKINSNFKVYSYDDKDILEAFNKVIVDIYDIKGFKLEVPFTSCLDTNRVELEYQTNKVEKNIILKSNEKRNLIYNNTSKSIYLGKISQLKQIDTTLELFATEDFVKLIKVESQSNRVNSQIVSEQAGVTKPAIVTLSYMPIDTNFFRTKVTLVTDGCENIEIFVSAGSRSGISNNGKLEITNPRDKELIFSDTKQTIEWLGIENNTELSIDYRSNNGGWQNISKQVTGRKYDWQTPNINSSIELRVSELSDNKNLDKVQYYSYQPNMVDLISWGELGNVAYATNNGAIYYLNTKSGAPFVIANSLLKVRTLKFAPQGTRIASSFDAVSGGNDVIVFDADVSQTPIKLRGSDNFPCSIGWNNSANIIWGGLENGTLNKWMLNSPNSPTYSIAKLHNGRINDIAYSDKYKYVITAGNDKWLKFVKDNGNVGKIDSIILNDAISNLYLSSNETTIYAITKAKSIIKIDYIKSDTIFQPQVELIQNTDVSYYSNNTTTEHIIANKDIITAAQIPSSFYSGQNKFLGHKSNISQLELDRNYNVASADSNGNLLIWDIRDIPHGRKVLSADTIEVDLVKFELGLKDLNIGQYCLGKVLSYNESEFFTNNTNTEITIDSVYLIGNKDGEISIETSFPKTIAKNSKSNLVLNFIPKVEGNKFDTLAIVSKGRTFKKLLVYKSYNPRYTLSSEDVDFGKLNLDENGIVKSFVITNNGTLDLKILNSEQLTIDTVFVLENLSYPVTIKPKESLEFKVTFLPKSNQRYNHLLKLNTQEFCTPIIVNLFGEGTQPNVLKSIEDSLGIFYCENDTIEKELLIQNIGKGLLKIKTLEALNFDSKFTIEIKDSTISSKDDLKIKLKFWNVKSNESGIVRVFTNNNFDGHNNIDLNLKLQKEKIDLKIIESSINFEDLLVNQSKTATISVVNLSSLEQNLNNYLLSNNLFEVESIQPISIKQNESAKFTIKFKGYSKDTIINEKFYLSDFCNQIDSINLIANVGDLKTNVSYATNETFLVDCKNNDTIAIKLINSGGNPLFIKELKLSSNEGARLLNTEDIVIPIGNNREIYVETNSNLPNRLELDLLFSSNTTLPNNSVKFILIKENNGFELIPDTINFGFVRIGTSRSLQKSVRYLGNSTINISTPILIEQELILDSISPMPIIAGKDVTFYFTYKPLSSSSFGTKFSISNKCQNLDFQLKGASIDKDPINIILPRITARVGDVVSLDYNLQVPTDVDTTNIYLEEFELSYNSSLLIPKSDYQKDTIIDGIRKTVCTFNQLKELKFLITLGDTNNSQLEIKHLPKGYVVNIQMQNGSLFVSNICYIGGGRYVEVGDKFNYYPPFPNPSEKEVTVKLDILEKGKYLLVLYDELGNSLDELFSGKIESNTFEKSFNLEKYSNGIYFLEIQSPSNSVRRKIMITK